ncbi:hypothetical protein [Krasilnikoviella flava]|uniref:ACT domain-containing protein n=1 Tax=Krasilnikoviella flava TaxID=526729 RepID=A0A1T5L967_9MICO|nr:hypothetical protein [Krasilnikoviella flava]SKC72209.1 hypothetical protein SAMN04324258_3120 [Krasilnikoviella flava]
MIYEIRVDGRIDPSHLADYATVTAQPQKAATVLTCTIEDASALTGMIAVLADLGMTVRDVHQVSAGSAATESSDGPPEAIL